MIIFEVAQEGYPIVNVIFYYQVAPAVIAFNDVFVQTRFYHNIMDILATGIRIFLTDGLLSLIDAK